MKKYAIALSLMLLSLNIYAKKTSPSTSRLPFVGTRYFNFEGASGTGSTITIKANGQVIFKGYSGDQKLTYVSKPQKYKYIMKDDFLLYHFSKTKAYIVDKFGHVEGGCMRLLFPEQTFKCETTLDPVQ